MQAAIRSGLRPASRRTGSPGGVGPGAGRHRDGVLRGAGQQPSASAFQLADYALFADGSGLIAGGSAEDVGGHSPTTCMRLRGVLADAAGWRQACPLGRLSCTGGVGAGGGGGGAESSSPQSAPGADHDRGTIAAEPSVVDRSVERNFGPPATLRAPPPSWRGELAKTGGVRGYCGGIGDRETPLVQFELRIRGGLAELMSRGGWGTQCPGGRVWKNAAATRWGSWRMAHSPRKWGVLGYVGPGWGRPSVVWGGRSLLRSGGAPGPGLGRHHSWWEEDPLGVPLGK